MDGIKITILTVSWYSADLLQDLTKNLSAKAKYPENLDFLIIDNTNGLDRNLDKLSFGDINAKILPYDPGKLKTLSAHAAGLNFGFKHVASDITLVIDPDTHIFKKYWDEFLVEIQAREQLDAIGTAFPSWWLGTYHNFPSPIFCFAKTYSLQKINADWMPPRTDIVNKLRNLILRQILRGFFVFNRRNLNSFPFMRKFTGTLEKFLPLCTIDTGFKLAGQARKANLKSVIFAALYPDELPGNIKTPKTSALNELSAQYELYGYGSEIFLTHQYGSQNFLLRTTKGRDRQYWKTLISEIEGDL